jgi:hypothetical protein
MAVISKRWGLHKETISTGAKKSLKTVHPKMQEANSSIRPEIERTGPSRIVLRHFLAHLSNRTCIRKVMVVVSPASVLVSHDFSRNSRIFITFGTHMSRVLLNSPSLIKQYDEIG